MYMYVYSYLFTYLLLYTSVCMNAYYLEDRRGYIYLARILFTCSTYVGLISKLHNSVDGVSLGVRGALN